MWRAISARSHARALRRVSRSARRSRRPRRSRARRAGRRRRSDPAATGRAGPRPGPAASVGAVVAAWPVARRPVRAPLREHLGAVGESARARTSATTRPGRSTSIEDVLADDRPRRGARARSTRRDETALAVAPRQRRRGAGRRSSARGADRAPSSSPRARVHDRRRREVDAAAQEHLSAPSTASMKQTSWLSGLSHVRRPSRSASARTSLLFMRADRQQQRATTARRSGNPARSSGPSGRRRRERGSAAPSRVEDLGVVAGRHGVESPVAARARRAGRT